MTSERVERYERTNRAFWDDDADDYQAAHHADISDAAWGAYRIPESELQVLGDLRGLAVLELGCGGAQASLALAGGAAQRVGLDLSYGQLRHAAAHVAAAGVAWDSSAPRRPRPRSAPNPSTWCSAITAR